eukprot:TRINITY_DN27543_c0_g1_i1.p2 TRINITY_DN27543_c0_g1~~TRINITY_DN27543_c0_g1_i1.p2  ORF type:complete len:134 (+),score=48.38 TRINITY_DN27543_c0_g1_i1:42-443(+)
MAAGACGGGAMDTMQCLATLEAYYEVLGAEARQLADDIAFLEGLTKRRGHYWNDALRRLRQELNAREDDRRDIEAQFALFALPLPTARKLCRRLSAQLPLSVSPASGAARPDFRISVDSRILANSDPAALSAR